MIIPLTERKKVLIVNNVIAAGKDIEKLNKTGYDYLYLCSGFIAHYDLEGFKDYYSEHSLKSDILEYFRFNKWTNFIPTDNNYDYYMSKKDVYARIVSKIS